MLEVKDLHKFYGSFHAVRGLSFHVDRGEVIGFLGPNGAGKTTTMKIVVGFMSMSSGEVRVDGHDVVDDSLAVRYGTGYLPEHAPLYEDMSVQEYLRFITDMRGLGGAQRKERIDYVVGVCALESKRRSGIKTLSKGYRQRVGLAQAIVHDPKLVILDEPTVGLDPNQIIEIRELIREIGSKNTVILSSHILSEVEATCSRVLIVNDGVIVANGPSSELCTHYAGVPTFEVDVRGEQEEVLAALKDLDVVKEAAFTIEIDGMRHFVVKVDDPGTFTLAFADLVKARSWILGQVARRRTSLEDVFKKLTSDAGGDQ